MFCLCIDRLNSYKNSIFSLHGFLDLDQDLVSHEQDRQFISNQIRIVHEISELLTFTNQFQDLGIKPPKFQNVNQTILYGISHLDLSSINRIVTLDKLEIFSDPLLETVFFTLAQNSILLGGEITEIRVYFVEENESVTIYFEDNGIGLSPEIKDKVFEWKVGDKTGMSLFLAREILSITGISIKETGQYGKGSRFEISAPHGVYRFSDIE